MRITLLSIFFCLAFVASAQTYELTYTNKAYSDLSGSVSLNDGQIWDDPDYWVPFGFTFDLFGRSLTDIYVDDIGLGAYLSHSTIDTGVKPLIMAYGPDIIDRGYDVDHSESEVSYLTTGSAPNRILKIEWKNFGFYGDLDLNDTCIDFGNLQIWFYESSNAIEMRFGPNKTSQPNLDYEGFPGPYLGLVGAFDYDNFEIIGGVHFASGNTTSPSLSGGDSISFMTGNIPDGSVYRFSLIPSGIGSITNQGLLVFPNPSNDILNIECDLDVEDLSIIDIQGRTALQSNNGVKHIDVSQLSKGTYILNVNTTGGELRKTIIIQ